MRWTVTLTRPAQRQLRRLPPQVQDRILGYLHTTVASADDPARHGKALKGVFQGQTSFRVGAYRIVAEIIRPTATVRVARIAHRKDAYD